MLSVLFVMYQYLLHCFFCRFICLKERSWILYTRLSKLDSPDDWIDLANTNV